MFRFLGSNKNILILILFLLIFNVISKELRSQSHDTIRIKVIENIYDTILVADTILVIDTVWIERKFDNLLFSASYSPFFTDWRGFNSTYLVLENKINHSFSLDFGFSKKNWTFFSGLKLSMLSNKMNFEYLLPKLDSVINEEITPNNYYLNDTISSNWEFFLDYTYIGDSLVAVMDSIQNFEIDSVLVTDYDTSYSVEYDTINVDTSVFRQYNFRFIEVPFVIEFCFAKIGNLSVNIGAGFIAGLLIKSELYYFDSGTKSVLAYNKGDAYKFLPSLWFSLGLNYNIGENFLIRLEPYYNPGLRPVLKTELPVIKIPDRYGVRLGVSYRF